MKAIVLFIGSCLATATAGDSTFPWPWKKKDTKEALSDEIHVLPGWEDVLPSRMFSGIVDAGNKTDDNGTTFHLHEHYFFVESEGDSDKDPLVVWTNGGPGASSMFGLFLELGPFYLSAKSHYTPFAQKTGIPSLFRNEYSWSKLANILIINSPPPVGYSYCEPIGPSGDGNSCGAWNDELTAHHNRLYLESFFQRFPKFKHHDVYITGESYAGVYVPTLVREILDHSAETYLDGDVWSLKDQLKGFAVGDGCMGTKNVCGKNGPGPLFNIEFMHGHGQFPDKMYFETFDKCTREELIGFNTDDDDGDTDDFGPNGGLKNGTCLEHLKKIEAAVGPYFAYGLYDSCWYQNDLEPPHNSLTRKRNYFSRVPPHSSAAKKATASARRLGEQAISSSGDMLQGALNDYPCGGYEAFFAWVGAPQVKAALHVDPDSAFFSGDNGVGFTYVPTEPDLLPFYRRVVSETDLRVLIYNGDTDPAINSFTAQNWTSHLGMTETEAWRPWTLDGKDYIGGYVTRYEKNFDFLTIRGAGHMVPQHKPKVSLEFLSKWLKNEPWQGWRTADD
ncbi:Carboxypeptidase Y homolog A [Seminavis robusta]|uniref:Carboxypeptidase n=1 Tax=Seminavis robusta TaxID=568900 RepID=A0A9N8HWG4_9STRA|nr:Carboxypeptidase Y homolog A [Seminavis robusta]|eukprot:Sro2172_g317550.1 Carboxypeptidase Y homolog A (561) ;mRNA; r:12445-14618